MRGFRWSGIVSLAVMASGPSWAQDDALRVELVRAEQRPVTLDLQLSGSIVSADSVHLSFRQAGRVIRVTVDEGDRIAQGQELARLDSVQQDQMLRVAEAGLAAARAGLAQARQADERAEALLARGVGTRAARDDARQRLSETEGATRRAESALEQARRAVRETVLRAPQDAVVTARSVAPGQIVGAAQVVLSIAALEGLEAVFDAPDHPRLDSAMGSPVTLDPIDIDRPTMRGTVSEISPLVDPTSGTVAIRVRIDDVKTDTALLGAAVRGRVQLAADSGIAVPWTAIMRDGDGSAVWRVDDTGRVSLVPVTIARFANGVIFLSGGIAPGDLVVGAGSQLLYPGRVVRQAAVLP